MSAEAAWKPDPTGRHELRYWDGSTWTAHVSDAGTPSSDPLPPDQPPPPPPAAATPPPPPPTAEVVEPVSGVEAAAAADTGPAAGKGSWKDKLKAAATQAAQQGKQLADKAKEQVADQQAKRAEQYANDPNTLWWGQSKNPATASTGISKATYRITKDRIWIESGLLGTKSEYVPLWAVKDIDVRQSLLQKNKDIGDVHLILEDPTYSVDPNWTGSMVTEPGGHTSGELLLDNIEGPFKVRDLLIPLVSEGRQKKLQERQTQWINVNPGMAAATGMVPPQPPPAPSPAATPTDVADQLRKLAELRDEGILSEEEFQAQKARLLGG